MPGTATLIHTIENGPWGGRTLVYELSPPVWYEFAAYPYHAVGRKYHTLVSGYRCDSLGRPLSTIGGSPSTFASIDAPTHISEEECAVLYFRRHTYNNETWEVGPPEPIGPKPFRLHVPLW